MPVPNLTKPQSYTPQGTYRTDVKSEVVYAEIDNMPIIVGRAAENMPTVPVKSGKDSSSVHRLPNPLRRHLKVLPKQ